nr:MAG TPA: PHAX RNA-binding domain [Caudoviricetes sp.]
MDRRHTPSGEFLALLRKDIVLPEHRTTGYLFLWNPDKKMKEQ